MKQKSTVTKVALIDGCAGPKLVPVDSIEGDLIPNLPVTTFAIADISDQYLTVGMIDCGSVVFIHDNDGQPALSLCRSAKGGKAEFVEAMLRDVKGQLILAEVVYPSIDSLVDFDEEDRDVPSVDYPVADMGIDLDVLVRAISDAGLGGKRANLVFTKGDMLHLGLPNDPDALTHEVTFFKGSHRVFGFWKSLFEYTVAELMPTGSGHDDFSGDIVRYADLCE